jgi:hypothetical protein
VRNFPAAPVARLAALPSQWHSPAVRSPEETEKGRVCGAGGLRLQSPGGDCHTSAFDSLPCELDCQNRSRYVRTPGSVGTCGLHPRLGTCGPLSVRYRDIRLGLTVKTAVGTCGLQAQSVRADSRLSRYVRTPPTSRYVWTPERSVSRHSPRPHCQNRSRYVRTPGSVGTCGPHEPPSEIPSGGWHRIGATSLQPVYLAHPPSWFLPE